jgi:hypothetical protein
VLTGGGAIRFASVVTSPGPVDELLARASAREVVTPSDG